MDKQSTPLIFDIWQMYHTVISFLTQSQKIQFHSTCKMIREITSKPIFWTKVQIGSHATQNISNQLQWFAKHTSIYQFQNLLVNFYEENQNINALFSQILIKKPLQSIKSLDIYSEDVDIHLICSLCFPNLQEITIRSKCVNDQLLKLMASNLHQLNSLIIIKNDIDFQCVGMSKYLDSPLKKLILKPYNIDFKEVQIISTKSADTLEQIQIDVQQCEQETLISIIKPLKKLKKLRLYHLENLQSEEQLYQVLKKQEKMSELVLTKAYNLALGSIFKTISSKYLTFLDITDSRFVNDEDMYVIAKECPNLKHINLSWCNSISSKGLSQIIRSCLNIQVLYLTGIKDSRDQIFGTQYVALVKQFDDEKFTKKKNEALDNKNLIEDEQIYEPAFFFRKSAPLLQFHEIRHLRKLQFLHCQSCNKISDEILKVIYIVNRRARTYNYYGSYMGLFPTQIQASYC